YSFRNSGQGQIDDGGGSLAKPAFDLDGAPVLHHHVAGDGQAEPGTLSRLLGRKEGFEDVLQVSGTDAAPVVADGEADGAWRLAAAQRDFAAGGNSVRRIAQQSQQQGLQQVAVGENQLPAAFGSVHNQVGVSREDGGLEEAGNGFDYRGQILRRLLQRQDAREIEQALHEVAAEGQ